MELKQVAAVMITKGCIAAATYWIMLRILSVHRTFSMGRNMPPKLLFHHQEACLLQ